MGALRVAVIAEGNGEARSNPLRGPGSVIEEDEWGPAHELVARLLESMGRLSRGAIQFVEPNRTSRGAVARGSQLLKSSTLRQLLSYPRPVDRPDLLIVLIDEDGESDRRGALTAVVADLPGTIVIAVATQEFEAWLIADADAVFRVVGTADRPPANVEGLAPGAAKEWLTAHLTATGSPSSKRLDLARVLSLVTVRQHAASFDALAVALTPSA